MRPIILALGMLVALHAQADTLANVFDSAWQRLPQAQSQVARSAEHQANQAAVSGLFPAPPVLGLAQRTDQFNGNSGKREIEIEISVPLWLPGEKSARQQVAHVELERYSAEQALLRLQLAGELREAIWQIKFAENARQQAQIRFGNTKQIEADVARRVRAGDLAKTDLLLAQSETMADQVALAEAERELLAARQAYRRIVGHDALPVTAVESMASDIDITAHPLLLEKRIRVNLAQAKAHLVSETRRDNPELSFNTRRERGNFSESYGNSIGVAIRIPFGADARNASRSAAAQGDLTEAEVALQRQRADIEQSIRKAVLDVDIAKQRSVLAASRDVLSQENLQWVRRAFSLGEKSLFEFQRAQISANEAALSASQSRLAIDRATARRNQAMGVLP